VPENALAREYRDLAGLANQQVAAAAAEVYLVVSGLAVDIKKIATSIEV
jgi:Adenosyl cobinamide kinase/adenosyl cobinamide phosphate guanylyltransferase